MYIAIILYLSAIILFAIIRKGRISNLKDFAGIGMKISNMGLLATIFASSIGGGTILGLTQKVVEHKFFYIYSLIISIPVDFAIIYFILPKMFRYTEVNSMAGFIGALYGKYARAIVGISTVTLTVGYLGVQIASCTYLLSFFFSFNKEFLSILIYIAIVTYTLTGGIKSAIKTHLIQFILIICAIPIVTFFTKDFVMPAIFCLKNSFYIGNYSDLIFTTFSFISLSLNPHFIHRALIEKNTEKIRKVIKYKYIIYCIFISFVVINGITAAYLKPGFSHPILSLIEEYIPYYIKFFIILGFFAATIANADSDISLASYSIAEDILKPIFNNGNNSLKIARISIILLGSLAIIAAVYFKNIIDIILYASKFWGPIVMVPFISALLFDIKISNYAYTSICLIVVFAICVFELDSAFALLLSFILFYTAKLTEKIVYS